MDKRKILVQLDSDPQPSVFDRIVALDAGADEVLSYGAVKPEQVRELVHGAIFTRGPKDLKRTALFIGGSDVALGERLLAEVRRHLLPQFRLQVSVLLDANGANTTAAAAVRLAGQHVELKTTNALVLGGTGPVGQRAAWLLASQGATVRVGSRQRDRAEHVCQNVKRHLLQGGALEAWEIASAGQLAEALRGVELVIAAGAAGVVLLSEAARRGAPSLRVAIDLNAVPPLGIEGVAVTDKAMTHDGVVCYGAVGVGDTKMKVHKLAVARLFESNDQVLDAPEVFALAQTV